jgi:hypothetical protein
MMTISNKPIAKLWLWLENNLNPVKIALVVLLVFIPLYPKFPLQGVEGTYVSLRVDDLVVLSAFFIWIIYQIKNKLPVLKENYFKFFLLYWAAGAVSLLTAIFITRLVDPKIALLHFIRRIEYMSMFLLAYDGAKKLKTAHLAKIISLTSIGVFIFGMGQKYFQFPVISTMNEEFSKGALLYLDKWTRISSTFAGHYDLAVWLVIVLSFFPVLIKESKKLGGKIFLALIMLVDFYLLTLTASRVSFVAYLIAISTTLLFIKAYRWIPIIVVASLVFASQSKELNIRLAVSFQDFTQITQKYTDKVASLVPKKEKEAPIPTPVKKPEPTAEPTAVESEIESDGLATKTSKKIVIKEVRTWPKPEEIEAAAARSSSIRFDVEWPRAVRAFLKNPLFGTGYSSIGLATDNDYLRTLGETGFVGFSCLALVIFHLLKTGLVKLVRQRVFLAAGMVGIIAGFLSNSIFIDVFEASKVAFYFWIITGIIYQKINSQNHE